MNERVEPKGALNVHMYSLIIVRVSFKTVLFKHGSFLEEAKI